CTARRERATGSSVRCHLFPRSPSLLSRESKTAVPVFQRVAILPAGGSSLIHEPETAVDGIGKRRGLNKQTDDHKRFVRKIEKVSRVHKHPLRFEQLQNQDVFR